jgi:hypothetical protein
MRGARASACLWAVGYLYAAGGRPIYIRADLDLERETPGMSSARAGAVAVGQRVNKALDIIR